MTIKVTEMLKVSNALTSIEGAKIKKWLSHEQHEEIVIIDSEENEYQIKYIPKRHRGE